MRSLIVAVALVSALASASGAFAQTTQQPAAPGGSLDQLTREHSKLVY
jgi:tripartite-type tricarboxylate transporter receptor subunit TctC